MAEKDEIEEQRYYMVVKSNSIIQNARYDLSLKEQKTVAYIISKIKPHDEVLAEYKFNVKEYCKVCGIEEDNGGNYITVKETLKGLRDKSIWIRNEEGKTMTLSWLSNVLIEENSGEVTVILDKFMHKYLVGLFENYTQYELITTLPMKSSYSIRMYEILKSYSFRKKFNLKIDELKAMLCCENYRYQDFKRRILDRACMEINKYTDIEVEWEPGKDKDGKKITSIDFWTRVRTKTERFSVFKNNEKQIDGQLNIFDIMDE